MMKEEAPDVLVDVSLSDDEKLASSKPASKPRQNCCYEIIQKNICFESFSQFTCMLLFGLLPMFILFLLFIGLGIYFLIDVGISDIAGYVMFVLSVVVPVLLYTIVRSYIKKYERDYSQRIGSHGYCPWYRM